MRRKKCFLIALSVIIILVVISATVGAIYLSEINRRSTLNSSHKDMFPLAVSESNITAVKVVTAFYDPEVNTYQIRIRCSNLALTELLKEHTPRLNAGGVIHETFGMIHSDGLWGKDLLLLFENTEFDENCLFLVGSHSCRLSPRS